MKSQQINWARIGQKAEERGGFGFVQKKTVVFARNAINRERDHKINFGPCKRPKDPNRPRPKSVNEHHKDNPDDDSAMRHKEADEAQIRETELQIRSNDRLKRPTDPPKIRHLQPATVTRQKRDDNHNHRPVAELQRQQPVPMIVAEVPRYEEVYDII